MGLTLRQQLATILLLVSCLAVDGVSWSPRQLRAEKETPVPEICPPCELLFTKLKATGGDGKLTQYVTVQERGEPKSGTGFMYFWAIATLMKTCKYLQRRYGQGSCTVEFNPGQMKNGQMLGRTYNRTMIFEPALGGSDSRCSCETIDRVTIVLTKNNKHTLPVETSCAYSHNGGMDIVTTVRNSGKTACNFADGSKVETKDDLWRCMHKANCEINDDWIQMAVFRDPRAMAVSAYFHQQVHGDHMHLGELDDFVARELPILCQWVAIRYMLFRGLLSHQSIEFWYDDVVSDPLRFHYDWFFTIGLQLPPRVVQAITKAAVADKLGFAHKDIDVHKGEKPTNESTARRFEDEVSPELVEMANGVLRVWLPNFILDKLGVTL